MTPVSDAGPCTGTPVPPLEPETCRRWLLRCWALINLLAERRFPDSPLAEEAALFVQEKLTRDDWSPLRAFEGRSSIATFITVLTHRLLEDFSHQKFGKPRIPDWIKANGPLWEETFRILCLEGVPAHEAINILETAAPGNRERDMLERMVDAILGRYPSCGQRQPREVHLEDNSWDQLSISGTHGFLTSPEDSLAMREEEQMLRLFEELTGVGSRFASRTETSVSHPLADRLRAHLSLTSEDRLLLRLLYQDGLTLAAAGQLLGMNTNQTSGKLRRLLERIRTAMKASGAYEEIKELLKMD